MVKNNNKTPLRENLYPSPLIRHVSFSQHIPLIPVPHNCIYFICRIGSGGYETMILYNFSLGIVFHVGSIFSFLGDFPLSKETAFSYHSILQDL